jgi:DNA-binding response OmpR family regulator
MAHKILIAEDDKAIVEVVKIILDEAGYTTSTIEDSDSVVKVVEQKKPDLILLDIWLSGEDGGEIAKILKSQEKTKKIPIIMISANNETEQIAKDAGADGFLKKPFDINDLLNIVKTHLS